MTLEYLNKYRSVLPTAQTSRVLDKLVRDKDAGKIKTIDQLKNRLKNLTQEILAQNIKPSLRLWRAIGGLETSYEQFNDMLERLEDDLVVAFQESGNITEIISMHEALLRRAILTSIVQSYKMLTKRVSLYELIRKGTDGFDDVLFETFAQSHITAKEQDTFAVSLYSDPRSKAKFKADDLVATDIAGERIMLPASLSSEVSIQKAEYMAGPLSTRSELDASFISSDPKNIVDGASNTYWIVPVLTESPITTGATAQVKLSLGSIRDISYIEIEPASNHPMELTALSYIDASGEIIDLDFEDVDLFSPARINFDRISCSALILSLTQENYTEVAFKKVPSASILQKVAKGLKKMSISTTEISSDLKAVLTSDFVLSDIISVDSTTAESKAYYEYVFGLDNVRAGLSSFADEGLFISQSKNVSKLGRIGLHCKEQRNYTAALTQDVTTVSSTWPGASAYSSSGFYQNSTEYWVSLIYNDINGGFVTSDLVPILPIGQNSVAHERLELTHKVDSASSVKDAGALMFYSDGTGVSVYKNGILLQPSTGWTFVPSTDSSNLTVTAANTGDRMRRGIQIVSEITVGDVFTVSYTPTVSNTASIPTNEDLLKIVDMSGDRAVHMGYNNILNVANVRKSVKIDSIDVRLVVVLKKNDYRTHLSPMVDEFSLFVGSTQEGKFTK
jgi:hypothetical protein